MSTVTMINTPAAHGWEYANTRLGYAVSASFDPRLSHLWEEARVLGSTSATPDTAWADRIAAVQILALRRADRAVTMQTRAAYIEVAEAAEEMLAVAAETHGIQPQSEALRILNQTADELLVKY